MIQPIHLIGDAYAADIPDPANAIINDNVITWKNSMAQGRGFIALPPGNWEIICTTKECTEDQAKCIVEHDAFIDGYKDYDTDRFHHEDPFIKALDSLRSLLVARRCDPNKNYVIIKRVS